MIPHYPDSYKAQHYKKYDGDEEDEYYYMETRDEFIYKDNTYHKPSHLAPFLGTDSITVLLDDITDVSKLPWSVEVPEYSPLTPYKEESEDMAEHEPKCYEVAIYSSVSGEIFLKPKVIVATSGNSARAKALLTWEGEGTDIGSDVVVVVNAFSNAGWNLNDIFLSATFKEKYNQLQELAKGLPPKQYIISARPDQRGCPEPKYNTGNLVVVQKPGEYEQCVGKVVSRIQTTRDGWTYDLVGYWSKRSFGWFCESDLKLDNGYSQH